MTRWCEEPSYGDTVCVAKLRSSQATVVAANHCTLPLPYHHLIYSAWQQTGGARSDDGESQHSTTEERRGVREEGERGGRERREREGREIEEGERRPGGA
jgi:hypothetical protein